MVTITKTWSFRAYMEEEQDMKSAVNPIQNGGYIYG